MTWLHTHLLSVLVFAPMCLGAFLFLLPANLERTGKYVAFVGASAIFVVAVLCLPTCVSSGFAERTLAFSLVNLPVEYHLAVDGLNLWLVLLTTLLTPLALAGTWNSLTTRPGSAAALFLMLETGLLGALMAQDMLLFYIFWEAMLPPMYFLILLWGGKDRRYAANKFILLTLAGSLLWLVALLYLGNKAGSCSPILMAQAALELPFETQCTLFLAFALAFAIKVPIFPLHTWLPDAHTEAPTAGSVILAGVLLKLGAYGFIRFAIPILPNAAIHYAKPIAILAVLSIVYGALVSMVQRDIKKLVAYSSVSHMGFVMLGISAMTVLSVQGAMFQMLSHGVSTGALFLMVGMLYDRAHTREIADFGGVATRMPIFTFFFLVITLSSIGFPSTNGFIGEFLVLTGTWSSGFGWGRPLAIAASSGVLLSAVYLLWMVKRVFWGPENTDEHSGTARLNEDLKGREIAVMIPIVALIFWMGLRPGTFLAYSDQPVRELLRSAGAPLARTPLAPSSPILTPEVAR